MRTALPRKRLIPLPGEGPEDVVVDRASSCTEPFRGAARSLICDSPKGLLELDPTHVHGVISAQTVIDDKENAMQTALCRKRLIPVPGEGPEDVVVDREGKLIGGVNDGRVLRVASLNGSVQELANTGGRPLGLEVLANSHIPICDSPKGLLELDPTHVHGAVSAQSV